MDCSTPGLPVHHLLLELTQTHVHWVGDAHPTISSSVVPFSSSLQSFPATGSFPMSQFLASGGQTIGVSASASGLPKNIQDWFPLGWTGWISLQSKGLSRVFSNTTVQKHQFFLLCLSIGLQRVRHDLVTGQCVFSWHLWPHFERHWCSPVQSHKQYWITNGGMQFKRVRKANVCFMLSEDDDNYVKCCYRLKVCVPLKLVCWNLTLRVTLFGCGGIWEVTGL